MTHSALIDSHSQGNNHCCVECITEFEIILLYLKEVLDAFLIERLYE